MSGIVHPILYSVLETIHLGGVIVLWGLGMWKRTRFFAMTAFTIITGLQICVLGCPLEPIIWSLCGDGPYHGSGISALYKHYGPVVAIPVWMCTTGIMILFWRWKIKEHNNGKVEAENKVKAYQSASSLGPQAPDQSQGIWQDL